MTNTSIVKKTLVLFVVWRTFLFLPFVLNFLKLTLQETYLGGRQLYIKVRHYYGRGQTLMVSTIFRSLNLATDL